MAAAPKLKAVPTKPRTLGALIDALDDAREVKRALAAQTKEAEAVYNELAAEIIAKMDAEDTRKGEGKKAGASITEVVVAEIEDFDALTKYVKRTGYFHLFQRRISDPAFRELQETKGSVPGLKPFTKRNLNLRSL